VRLLYVCSDFGIPVRGVKGASIHLRSITTALAALGHEVAILSPNLGSGDDHATVPVLAPPSKSIKQIPRRMKTWLSAHGLGDGVAREFRSLWYSICAGEEQAEQVNDFAPDAVIERLSLMGHVGVDIAQRLGIPHILEVNAVLTEEAAQFRSLHLDELATSIENKVLQQSDRVMAVSDCLAQKLSQRGVNPTKIDVIPNGVNIERFVSELSSSEMRRALQLPDVFTVGFVGTFKPWHGVETLINSFSRLVRDVKRAHLLLVGSGPQQEGLRTLVNQLGIEESVTFLGAIPHAEVPRALRAMDVAVAPSHQATSFYYSPIKLFEYMAAGACVVASRIGQMADILQDNVSGLLVEPDDVDDLAAKLKLTYDNPALRKQLSQSAFDHVCSRYTWRHAAQEVMRTMDKAVRRRMIESQPDDPHQRLERIA